MTEKTLRSTAEALVAAEKVRKRLMRQVEAAEKTVNALKAKLVEPLKEATQPNVAMRGGARVFVEKQPIVTVQDFKAVLGWALANDCPQVIHQRVSATQVEKLSYEERFVDGVVLDHKYVVQVRLPRNDRNMVKKGISE